MVCGAADDDDDGDSGQSRVGEHRAMNDVTHDDPSRFPYDNIRTLRENERHVRIRRYKSVAVLAVVLSIRRVLLFYSSMHGRLNVTIHRITCSSTTHLYHTCV